MFDFKIRKINYKYTRKLSCKLVLYSVELKVKFFFGGGVKFEISTKQ